MDMITISAKTLDEAITKALLELQITSDHLYYEVVQKESAGLFGIFGAKPCIIRARAKSEEEEKALKKEADEKEKAAKAAAKAEKEAAKQPVKNVKPVEKKVEKAPAKPVEKSVEKAADKNAEKPAKQAEKSFEKPEKKEFKKDFDKKKHQPKREEAPVAEEKAAEPVKAKLPVKVDEEKVKKDAKEFLNQVFGAMGMSVDIEASYNAEEGELLVSMAGDDMGILIGKRGQTLDSLQYLVSLVVNKETEGYLRVKLDTENYRERRKETLETLAKNISYKVKRTKRPVSLEPMNPYERRIIHSALQNDRYVVTRSEGEDPYRHVVISLKREAYGNGGNGRKDRYQNRKDRDNKDGKYERPARRHYDRRADKSAEKNAEKNVEKSVETQSEN